MTLTFPNKSRSFDESRNAVRFSGYDGMFEVRFLVEANALRTASQPGHSEDECLRAFDMAREIILEAATRAYGRSGKVIYPDGAGYPPVDFYTRKGRAGAEPNVSRQKTSQCRGPAWRAAVPTRAILNRPSTARSPMPAISTPAISSSPRAAATSRWPDGCI